MNKNFYIIPGWEDNCNNRQYQKLASVAKEMGYEVVCKNVDWKKPLSQQIFVVLPNSVIFGFSLGAILAWLVAQKYPCEHLIVASMTLHESFEKPEDKTSLIELTGKDFVQDIIDNLTPSHKAKKQTVMYGDLEGEKADILVFDTEHELTDAYIEEIRKTL